MTRDALSALWPVSVALIVLAMLAGCYAPARMQTVTAEERASRAATLTAPAAAKTFPFGWENPPEIPSTYTTEVWATTNLSTWYLKTNVPGKLGTNAVSVPATLSREFFKIRSRGTNGLFSPWSAKRTL